MGLQGGFVGQHIPSLNSGAIECVRSMRREVFATIAGTGAAKVFGRRRPGDGRDVERPGGSSGRDQRGCLYFGL